MQFEIEIVVNKFDRLAGAQVLKVHVAATQLDPRNTQRERLAGRFFDLRLRAGRNFEQLGQVKPTVLTEQHFAVRLVQLDISQVQHAAP